jgi:DNA-binding beta-propeller fold protein YncE
MRATSRPSLPIRVLGGLLAVVILGGCSSAAPSRTPRLGLVACSTAVSSGRSLTGVSVSRVAVPGLPFAAVSVGRRWAFASLTTSGVPRVAVLKQAADGLRFVRTVALPGLLSAFGLAVTPDGRLLIIATAGGTVVMRVSALESGASGARVGVLSDSGSGQSEVAVSPAGKYVFVSDETTGAVSIFDLARALQRGFSARGVALGLVSLAPGAVGVALSPNGRRLYATTFGGYGPHGLLWTLNATAAERHPASGDIVAKANAGCQPVRVQVAPNGSEVWVTALQSNALLAYNAGTLERQPRKALQAVVPVGSEPVGLALANDGQIALVANSNRGLVPGTGSNAPQRISVINTQAALDHRPALIGSVPAGRFPRDITYNPATKMVLSANYNSSSIQEFPTPAR